MQSRGIASISYKSRLGMSTDPLAVYTPKKRRILKALTSGNLHQLDFNGDGKRDVRINKIGKAYTQVAYAPLGDGRFHHIVVYNEQNRRIKERFDSDMDGQVDYHYECKDQVCITKSAYSEGKPSRVLRQVYKGPNVEYSLQELKNGQFVVVDSGKGRVQSIYNEGNIGFPVAGQEDLEGDAILDCEDCDGFVDAFNRQLQNFAKIQEAAQRPDLKVHPELSDFYISKTGFLLHRSCFEGEFSGYGLEEKLIESLVTGMDCFSRGDEYFEGRGEKSAARYTFMPRIVKMLDQNNFGKTLNPSFYDSNNNYREVKSCNDLKKEPFFRKVGMVLETCDVMPQDAFRPKITCGGIDSYEKYLIDKFNSIGGIATANSSFSDPMVVNYEGKTRVYTGANISINSPISPKVIFHEILHLLGAVHTHPNIGSYNPNIPRANEYSDACEAFCFSSEELIQRNMGEQRGILPAARKQCFSPTFDEESWKFADQF
tara:strand:+ start:4350 stop:5807 length:1458 start_codon:yes stop_codon:yes gene_type:complete